MKKSNKPKEPKEDLGKRFKNRCKSLFLLFWSMFKIGLFTFGGGYAMIHLLENEFVAKKKWLDNDEFFDLVTIAESTPGPVAINCSTYIGYKTNNFIGALVATTAMCIPSFVIIFVISLFFNAFLENVYIAAAFRGIQVCAVFLIFCAGIKMAKKIKINIYNIIIFAATFIAMILVSIFNAKFSSIFYILISGAIGLFIYSIGYFKKKIKDKKCPVTLDSTTLTDTEGEQILVNNSTENAENSTLVVDLDVQTDDKNCDDNDNIEIDNNSEKEEQIDSDNQNSTDFQTVCEENVIKDTDLLGGEDK